MQSEIQGGRMILIIRLVALSMLLVNFCFAAVYFDPFNLLTYFTNWNMEVTLALVIIVICKSFDPKIQEKKEWLCVIHLLTEVSCTFNLLTVIMYWCFVHQEAMKEPELVDHQMRILHMYLVHTFPTFSLGIIFATTDI